MVAGMRRVPAAVALSVMLWSCGKNQASEQARHEADFEKMLTNATLAGRFTSRGSDRIAEDRYTISKVSKIGGDLWLIHSRIQYGQRDVTVPVPVKVVWAGDTPMIQLTDATIPGLGTYSARVLFFRDEYAGTWSGGDHGGQMFGRIERAAAPK
jgi:hypothetical protein